MIQGGSWLVNSCVVVNIPAYASIQKLQLTNADSGKQQNNIHDATVTFTEKKKSQNIV
jgi:hypothetical protein